MNDLRSCAMKVTFLGWWGAFPQPGGACSSVLVQTEEGGFLLDCGSGALSQFYKFAGIGELEGVVLSHLHFDHMSDIGSLFYAVNNGIRTGKRGEKLKVYSPATPHEIRGLLEYPMAVTETYSAGMTITLAGAAITAMKVKHPVECYAFRLERKGKVLVYLTDTEYPHEAGSFLRDADFFICEASITKGSTHTTGIGHMSDLEAGRCARENNAKELCLFHLPGDGNPEYMRGQAELEFGGKVHIPGTAAGQVIAGGAAPAGERVFYL